MPRGANANSPARTVRHSPSTITSSAPSSTRTPRPPSHARAAGSCIRPDGVLQQAELATGLLAREVHRHRGAGEEVAWRVSRWSTGAAWTFLFPLSRPAPCRVLGTLLGAADLPRFAERTTGEKSREEGRDPNGPRGRRWPWPEWSWMHGHLRRPKPKRAGLAVGLLLGPDMRPIVPAMGRIGVNKAARARAPTRSTRDALRMRAPAPLPPLRRFGRESIGALAGEAPPRAACLPEWQARRAALMPFDLSIAAPE